MLLSVLFGIAWNVWVLSTAITVVRHDIPIEHWHGCHFIYQGPRCCAWPMHRTNTVLCWERATLIEDP